MKSFLIIAAFLTCSCSMVQKKSNRLPASEDQLTFDDLSTTTTKIDLESCLLAKHVDSQDENNFNLKCPSFVYDSVSVVKSPNATAIGFGRGSHALYPRFYNDPKKTTLDKEINWVFTYGNPSYYNGREIHYIAAYYFIKLELPSGEDLEQVVVVGFSDRRGGNQSKLISILENEKATQKKKKKVIIDFYEEKDINYNRCDDLVKSDDSCS